MARDGRPPAIAAYGIDKSFAATRALDGADLVVARGEIVALMGANGAGKSTLVKILSGTLQADAGHVEIAGKPVSIPSPQAARALGIATVHQQTNQAGAPGLTVAENLILDELCSGASPVFLTPRAIRRRAGEIAAALDLDLPLDRDFTELAAGRAPADRHCPRGRREIVGADPRRADVDAVGRRGRAAVRHPETAACLRHRYPLHLASAGRPAAHRRPRRGAARRPGGRRIFASRSISRRQSAR